MIEVYWGSGSPFAWRVLLALEIKGIAYTSKLMQFSDQEHKSEAYLEINPRGKIPAITDGPMRLRESLAIIAYLEAKQFEPPLLGRTPAETGAIWCAIMECANYVELPSSQFIVPILNKTIKGSEASIAKAVADIDRELTRVAARLENDDYLVGDAVSAADLALYPFVRFLERMSHHPDASQFEPKFADIANTLPVLKQWCKRIEAVPGYEKTYPPHWRRTN